MKNMTKEEAMAILELKEGYKDEDIQIAFRKASKKYHPDLNDSEDAEKMMISIQVARNTLMHNLNFESIKQEQINEIEKIINESQKMYIYDKNIKKIYTKARDYEKQALDEWLKNICESKNKFNLDEANKAFRSDMVYIIKEFIAKIASDSKLDNIFIENAINECVSYQTINEALKRFLELRNIEYQNLPYDENRMVNNKIYETVLKYTNNKYFNALENHVNRYVEEAQYDYLNNGTFYETESELKVRLKDIINNLETKLSKLFSSYQSFIEYKIECIDRINSIIETVNKNYRQEVINIYNTYKEKLDSCKTKDEFKNVLVVVWGDIKEKVREIEMLIEKEEKDKYLNTIKDNIINKFISSNNGNLQLASRNSNTLNRAIKCLLSAQSYSSTDRIKYLDYLTFADEEKDDRVLNFVSNNAIKISMPAIVIPRISYERVLDLYRNMKPIIDINGKKYKIREFNLTELINYSYFKDLQKNIGTPLEHGLVLVHEFNCFHNIEDEKQLFRPKIHEVLSQLPREYLDSIGYFEIDPVPNIVYDESCGNLIDVDYHQSNVKIYKKLI